MDCEACGIDNRPGRRFCAECGAPLVGLAARTDQMDPRVKGFDTADLQEAKALLETCR